MKLIQFTLIVTVLFGVTKYSLALEIADDFTGGLNLPWVFIDDFGDSPPSDTNVVSNDNGQDLKIIGSAEAFDNDNLFNASTTGYVGIGDDSFFLK